MLVFAPRCHTQTYPVISSYEPAGARPRTTPPRYARWLGRQHPGPKISLLGERRGVVFPRFAPRHWAAAGHAACVEGRCFAWAAPRIVACPVLRRKRRRAAVARAPFGLVQRCVRARATAARGAHAATIAVAHIAANSAARAEPEARLARITRAGAVGARAAFVAAPWNRCALPKK